MKDTDSISQSFLSENNSSWFSILFTNMFTPVSTYRIQFNKEFTFSHFEDVMTYLKSLGIKTVYASPVLSATPGSSHGYDGLNPHQVNAEIGSLEQLKDIINQLQGNDMHWLQDIVPNHMAFDQRNEWLADVLEKGPQSPYVSFFDTAWTSQLYHGRIMVPFLGSTLEEVIEKGELKINYTGDRFVFDYFGNTYPLQPGSYPEVLQASGEKVPEALEQFIGQLPKTEDQKTYAHQWDDLRRQLSGLLKNDAVSHFITNCLEQVNNNKDVLKKIADSQSYRLCHWQETDARINYRRFFTVNGLICLNIQDENVFNVYHELIRQLTESGLFSGLRIDHIDGLYDPAQYLQRLREMAGDETYVVVEKILEPGEKIPKYWPVQGTTGYDFLSTVNNVLTYRNSQRKIHDFYHELTGSSMTTQELVHDKKSYILYHHMAGELDNLFRLFMELNLMDKSAFARMRKEEIKEAIGEFLIHCPVYRYYASSFPLQGAEYAAVQDILNRIRKSSDLRRAVDLLEEALLKKPQEGNEERNARALIFYKRCMQFTGPLMAKGVEDTLMYTYDRFIGHNEVGDAPDSFGLDTDNFHQAMTDRQQRWPLTLNATSTHDTKRGEDVRARLNVLTALPDLWIEKVREWQVLNAAFKNENAPDANDEYFIYQTIAGAYPMPGEEDNFESRVTGYLQKALREAKHHSNWTAPDTSYEESVKQFIISILKKDSSFYKSFSSFHKKIADYGIINSMVQLVLKFTCPGIPDTYQGTELWDLSLVDPDNRRPVDYEKRKEWLKDLKDHQPDAVAGELWNERYTGKIKLWLTYELLHMRNDHTALFTKGEYLPLKVEGTYKNNVLAFARKDHQSVIVIAVPVHLAVIAEEQQAEPGRIDWKDTQLILPDGAVKEWTHLIWNTKNIHKKKVDVSRLFGRVPFALLKSELLNNERGAGVLLHITSLASPFGIGDMGPEAKAFAYFLSRSKQKYWQLLPLNPTEHGQGHSPYSSISSRAGNVLIISPDRMVKEGLLTHEELKPFFLPQEGRTNYAEAERVKTELFKLAWDHFKDGKGSHLKHGFDAFKQKETEWLNDFAYYILLKKINGGKPWYEWEEKFKRYDPEVLKQLEEENTDELEKIKWLQYIFQLQWKRLKDQCNSLNIRLIGDLPFYISYDSVDVWSHRELFAVDDEGRRTGMAGVPPDSFSADGQLWGMPVFKWDVLKQQGYKWWIQRLKRNLELFDLVRLDHFRAFSAYWEVAAGEQTARNGQWKQGPGEDFFAVVKKELGELPFVAEDLGEIDEPVYQLRDEFNLPGMKVLQFAFGEDMSASAYIPHHFDPNFIVYTGTHDNNTTRGWINQEGAGNRNRIEQYMGRSLSENDVPEALIRMAYASVARLAIVPFQDVLGLDEHARMNIPASGENNWAWRLTPGQVDENAESKLREWVVLYGRE